MGVEADDPKKRKKEEDADAGSAKKKKGDDQETKFVEPTKGASSPHTGKRYSSQFFKILEARRRLPCWDMRSRV